MFFRAIAILIALAAGFAASQAPEFAQQYRQRLGGAVDELARVIDSFNANAAASGTDQAGGLAIMARNDEPLVRAQAVSMAVTIIRYDRLRNQQAALASDMPFTRLVAFMRNFDRPLVESTLRSYEPAVPATSEGVVFAVVGFLGVYLILGFLGFLFRPRRRRHHRHHHQPVGSASPAE